MKYLLIGLVLFSPVLVLNYVLMPEIAKLHDFYANIDDHSQRALAVE